MKATLMEIGVGFAIVVILLLTLAEMLLAPTALVALLQWIAGGK